MLWSSLSVKTKNEKKKKTINSDNGEKIFSLPIFWPQIEFQSPKNNNHSLVRIQNESILCLRLSLVRSLLALGYQIYQIRECGRMWLWISILYCFCLRLTQKWMFIRINSIYSRILVYRTTTGWFQFPVFATCVHCFCHFLLRMQFLQVQFCFKYRVYCSASTECLLFVISSLAVREKCFTLFGSVAFPLQTIYQTWYFIHVGN